MGRGSSGLEPGEPFAPRGKAYVGRAGGTQSIPQVWQVGAGSDLAAVPSSWPKGECSVHGPHRIASALKKET